MGYSYAERRAQNLVESESIYFKSIKTQPIYTTVGTAIAHDGLTGRTIAATGDGVTRYENISSSSILGTTSGAFAGKFADGRGG